MISKFSVQANLAEPVNAIIPETIDITKVNYKQPIQVYIQKYMPEIPMGKPGAVMAPINPNIFMNRNETMPIFSAPFVKVQNFITGVFADDNDDKLRIAKVSKNGKGKIYGAKIQTGSAVRAYFMNGRISRLIVETSILEQGYTTAEDAGISRYEDLFKKDDKK